MSATDAPFPEDVVTPLPIKFDIFPSESIKDAIRRQAYGITLPFGFYYPAFESLVPVLKNGDVYAAGYEALSLWGGPPIAVSIGVFMLVVAIWIASSVVSYPTTPFRWFFPIKRPFLRRLFAYIISIFANMITDSFTNFKPAQLNFQVGAPGFNISKAPTANEIGFNFNATATTIKYSLSLTKDPQLALVALLDSFVDELSNLGPLGSKKSRFAFPKIGARTKRSSFDSDVDSWERRAGRVEGLAARVRREIVDDACRDTSTSSPFVNKIDRELDDPEGRTRKLCDGADAALRLASVLLRGRSGGDGGGGRRWRRTSSTALRSDDDDVGFPAFRTKFTSGPVGADENSVEKPLDFGSEGDELNDNGKSDYLFNEHVF